MSLSSHGIFPMRVSAFTFFSCINTVTAFRGLLNPEWPHIHLIISYFPTTLYPQVWTLRFEPIFLKAQRNSQYIYSLITVSKRERERERNWLSLHVNKSHPPDFPGINHIPTRWIWVSVDISQSINLLFSIICGCGHWLTIIKYL